MGFKQEWFESGDFEESFMGKIPRSCGSPGSALRFSRSVGDEIGGRRMIQSF